MRQRKLTEAHIVFVKESPHLCRSGRAEVQLQQLVSEMEQQQVKGQE